MAQIHDSVSATGRHTEFVNNGGTVVSYIDGSGFYNDRNGTSRLVPNPTAKTIVDGAPTDMFSVTVAASQVAGGTVAFVIRAADGTNTQAMSGIATYSAVATAAGTVTGTITYVAANEAKTLSSGTLTAAFTANVSGSTCTFRVQPTGSLTETAYTISYTLLPVVGSPTIL